MRNYFLRSFSLVILFSIGIFLISDFDNAYGLTSDTIGFPLGSHDQSKWYGPMPNNGVGSLAVPMKFVNNDSEAHHIVLGYDRGDTYDMEMPANNSFNKIIEPGETFAFKFSVEDTYDWHCEYHPWMKGNVRIGVWVPPFTPISVLGEESFANHIVWSGSMKLTKYNFNQKNPQSPTALADIGVEFSFKPNFEYTKYIPCEINIHSTDVTTLFSKSRSDWSQSRIAASVLTEKHVLNHEQKHLDIGEVVARETEDRINAKYVGKTFPCNSPLNSEFRNMANTVEQEAFRINTQYDNEVYGGNPTLEERMQNQANWNVRVECFLEKRGFDSSCLTLTGTWTQNDLKIETKSPSQIFDEFGTEPTYQPPYQPPQTQKTQTQKITKNYYLEGYPGDVIKKTAGGTRTPETNTHDIKYYRILGGDYPSWINLKKLDFGLLSPGEFSKKISWLVTIPDNQKPGKYSFTWEDFCEIKGNPCKTMYIKKYFIEVKSPSSSSSSNYDYSGFRAEENKNPNLKTKSSLIPKSPSLSSTGDCPFDTRKLQSHAYGLVRNNHLEKAMECFEKLIKLDPDYTTVLFDMAKTSNKLENYDDAIKWISKATPFHNNGHLINKITGDAYLGKGDYKRAISEYDMAISKYEMNPDTSGTYRDAQNGKIEAEKMSKQKVVVPPKIKEKIPVWIKNNAKWWADGTIDDNSFKQGIQFMIKENIMDIDNLPSLSDSSESNIPDWVKNNAKWWAEGIISEDDFVNGIKHMIEKGLIKIS